MPNSTMPEVTIIREKAKTGISELMKMPDTIGIVFRLILAICAAKEDSKIEYTFFGYPNHAGSTITKTEIEAWKSVFSYTVESKLYHCYSIQFCLFNCHELEVSIIVKGKLTMAIISKSEEPNPFESAGQAHANSHAPRR